MHAQFLYFCALVKCHQFPTKYCSHSKVHKHLRCPFDQVCITRDLCAAAAAMAYRRPSVYSETLHVSSCIPIIEKQLCTLGCTVLQQLSAVATQQKGFWFITSGGLGPFSAEFACSQSKDMHLEDR